MEERIHKTRPCTCPKCGQRNKQIVQRPYPMYDERTDTVIKWYICDGCLTEWFEHFNLTYAGAGVIVFNKETSAKELVEFDKNGHKIK